MTERRDTNARPIHILLVEDDDCDFELMQLTLKRDRIINTLARVHDGVEAMEYLRREGPYEGVSRPDLVLLDLNMPRMNGQEVLREIKSDPGLETLPVVIFTSSNDERDVLASYKYKANSYVTKPVDLAKFRSILAEIQSYWFCVVSLPGAHGESSASRRSA